MINEKSIPEKVFVNKGKEIETIIKKAVKEALIIHKRANNPVVGYKDGELIIVSPENIPE